MAGPPVGTSREVLSAAPMRLRRVWTGRTGQNIGPQRIGAATGRQFSSRAPNKTIDGSIGAPTENSSTPKVERVFLLLCLPFFLH